MARLGAARRQPLAPSEGARRATPASRRLPLFLRRRWTKAHAQRAHAQRSALADSTPSYSKNVKDVQGKKVDLFLSVQGEI